MTTSVQLPTDDRFVRACRYIEANLDRRLTLPVLARIADLSPFRFQREFKRRVGITPRQYAETCRMRLLKGRLRDGETVTSALYDVGFGSSSRLYEKSATHLGMPPGVYQRGGPGLGIWYGLVDTGLGLLLVARTERGVCAVRFGSSRQALLEELRREFPGATLEPGEERFGAALAALGRFVDGAGPAPRLPLDIRATAFQRRVWEQLRTIPQGETRSYGDVARAIGRPQAARAVARACASNPVAVVIPCHRVVAADGSAGGYRWGVSRKRRLLARERREGR